MKLSSKLEQRLHVWWPAAAVLVVGVSLSAGLWQVLEKRQIQTVQDRLDQQAHLFSASVEQRLLAYGDIVQGLRALLDEGNLTAQDAFTATELAQEISVRHPGVESINHVLRLNAQQYSSYRLHLLGEKSADTHIPESQMPMLSDGAQDRYVVESVWPPELQSKLRGLDMGEIPAIKQLIAGMRWTDRPALSAPFPLKQTGAGKTGVLLSVALKNTEGPLAGEAEAPTRFLNLSVRIERMMVHFLSRGLLSDVVVTVRDMGRKSGITAQEPEGLLVFRSEGWDAIRSDSLRSHRELLVGGRIWALEFAPRSSMLSGAERYFSWTVAAGVLCASSLLAAIVLLLSLQRSRAQLRAQAKHHLLRERTGRLNALFHQSAMGVAEIDPASERFISANMRFVEVLGYSLDALETMDVYDVLHPDERAAAQSLVRDIQEGKRHHFSVTQRLMREDGTVIWCEAWVSPLQTDEAVNSDRLIVLLQDVSERRLMQEQLQAREAYSSEMLRYMPVGLVVVGPQGDIEFVNHQFEVSTGWSLSDLSDESSMWRLLCADGQQHSDLRKRLNAGRCEVVPSGVNMPAMEYLLRGKDGQELIMEVSGRFLGGRILLSFVDVTSRKAAEAEIRWLGFYDTLTQLPNRRLLLDRLGEALVRSQRTNAPKGALLLLDLDNFKSLNETLGHELGDALLRLVATRLNHCIPGHYTLARQGGDEFAVVLEDLSPDPLEAGRSTEHVGCSILQALRAPFYLGHQDFYVTVSMGAVVFSGHMDTVEEMLKRADLALYQAKNAGRDTLQFFDPSMQKAVSARVEMEKDLRQALDRHEFDLFYQPQVQGDKVVGAEALLRWKHPRKGYIQPASFVPAAEESGLILPLGEWVLFAACRQLAHWALDPAMADLTMAVNVSPRQFYQPSFVQQVEQALRVTGANPERLELELTEGMLLTDVEDTIRKMVQLKAMGVIFSLDDFGTGYSSMSYLKRLPLDKLKIDQGFVKEVVTSANDAAITRSIIALGHSLGLQVIAEGVETQAQRDFLAVSGCIYCQGFYFSHPQPQPEFEAWVRSHNATSAGRAANNDNSLIKS